MRFFLDNCLSPNLAKALNCLSEPDGYTVRHLSEVFPERNTPDEIWLPELARQGDWIVISSDLRIFRSPQLRKIWKESSLTTFFLAKGWANHEFWQQSWWLVRWWPSIIDQAKLVAPGAGFEVPAQPTGKFKLLTSPST